MGDFTYLNGEIKSEPWKRINKTALTGFRAV